MWSRASALLFLLVLLAAAGTAAGKDQEGCLICHRLGLVREAPGGPLSLRVWDPPGATHAGLRCSDCHPDAVRAPHASLPGPAACIGSCHGSTPAAAESHRKAAFGGLTESHRPVAAPGSPCRICHAAADPRGDRTPILSRCVRCHPAEGGSLARGIHARLSGATRCIGCHPAHPEGEKEAEVSCGGAGCHSEVSAREIRLAGHDTGSAKAGGRVAGTGLFLAIALSGWFGGRLLSPRRKGAEERK